MQMLFTLIFFSNIVRNQNLKHEITVMNDMLEEFERVYNHFEGKRPVDQGRREIHPEG